MAGGLVAVGAGVTCAVVFVAPLLVGTVHRPAVIGVTLAAGVAALLVSLGELWRRVQFRITSSVLLPVSLLLIPWLQSIPLPASLARRIDSAGDALLAQGPAATAAWRPLSLDPPETRAIVAKAGAALAVFLIAFHLASGRSRRLRLIRVVGASAMVAVAIGLGHRILGETQLFGHFSPSRGLLNGPFINSNHIAEFLELGAFVCVAAALAGTSALNRVGWLSAALLAGACVLGTFSRGGVLGLAAGMIVFVALRQGALPEEGVPGARNPRRLLWGTLMLIVFGALAVSLGADQVVAKIRDTQITQETRWALWKDSLRVLLAHPFGIGRGAFERVFPVYRTVEGGIAVRFSFVENEPLQYLVEMGWLGFLIVAGALVAVVIEWAHARRRDQVEAALAAGVAAVLIHNVVDFGLETVGMQLPFAAILGTLLGRTGDLGDRALPARGTAAAFALALGGIVFGCVSLARASSRDFDRLLESAPSAAAKREIALRAQEVHPLDYLYVLAQAAVEPIAPDAAGRSPRLHALNRALELCPQCPDIHSAVGSTLWTLGRREQALHEWQVAVETRPVVFGPLLQRALAAGARPGEIAVIAGDNPERLIGAASYLMSQGKLAAVRVLLPLASQAGAPAEQVLLIQAKLDIDAGATEQALKSLEAARKLAPQNPRVFLLLGEAKSRAGRVDEALRDLEAGIGMNPHDLSLLRSRLDLVMREKRWVLAQSSLDGLEIGLLEAQLPTIEVHLAAARYYTSLRDFGKASSEYNLALAQDSSNVQAWLALGMLWEEAGRAPAAIEAYRQATAAQPGNPQATEAIKRLTSRIETLRAAGALVP